MSDLFDLFKLVDRVHIHALTLQIFYSCNLGILLMLPWNALGYLLNL
jgi:hypothetical protein